MLPSWLSGARRPSKRQASRSGGSSLQGLEFTSVPEFLRKPVLRADRSQQSDAPQGRLPREKNCRKRSPASSTDFNPLRSGGRFTVASSPIDASVLGSSKSPFHAPRGSGKRSGELVRQSSDAEDFKVAAEVLRAINVYAMKKQKEVRHITELEVVDVLLSNIDNVFQVPFAYRSFLAFSMNEFTDELVRFYKDATDAASYFKGKLPFHVANRLYEQYIIADAPHEINVSGKMKEEIKAHLDHALEKQRSVSVDVFDSCMFEVRSLMEDQTFARFKRKVNGSRAYAQSVWADEIVGIDDFELENRDTILLYNLFADIKTGLDKLKILTTMSRKQARYAPDARFKRSDGMYNTAALVPTRVGDLRYDEY